MELEKQPTREELAQYFEMPIKAVAALMGISLTQLKRVCRQSGIPRWPYRKIQSIYGKIHEKQISMDKCTSTDRSATLKSEIDMLQQSIDAIKNDPSSLNLLDHEEDSEFVLPNSRAFARKRTADISQHAGLEFKRVRTASPSPRPLLRTQSLPEQRMLYNPLDDMQDALSKSMNELRYAQDQMCKITKNGHSQNMMMKDVNTMNLDRSTDQNSIEYLTPLRSLFPGHSMHLKHTQSF
ncbi:hypothetical protein AKO1_006461 [Acrasis kona]|uniref:RWP-RK domain-containing protein n=1 Tax=Acrasis kona TaxID=1008807 RepID=A0AAW2ZNK6_9EUKA